MNNERGTSGTSESEIITNGFGQNSGELEVEQRFKREVGDRQARVGEIAVPKAPEGVMHVALRTTGTAVMRKKNFEESGWKEGRTSRGVDHRRKRGRRKKREGQTACSAFWTSWKAEAVRDGRKRAINVAVNHISYGPSPSLLPLVSQGVVFREEKEWIVIQTRAREYWIGKEEETDR
ncbi:hypothetical protein R3P38DRAFT_2804944 [Favolaschia claudopus]|uniref:Uncharacterized protein n=1 Tax=Favolaschia claudopus TaxID=2862362 RepID=A0AAV9ZNX6_9AGAR